MTKRPFIPWQAALLAAVAALPSLPAAAEELNTRMLFLGPRGPRLIEVRLSSGRFGVGETRRRYAEALFQHLDRDGDGRLSPEEAEHIPRDGRLRAGGETLGERWRELDAPPGDGTLSPEELLPFIDEALGPALTVRRRPPRQSQTVRLFEDLDVDGDGRVSFEELVNGFEILRTFDFDDDETLSVAELQPFPLSVIQAQRQQAADEEPLPLILIEEEQLSDAAERCLAEYGGGAEIPAENLPALPPREFARFDRNRDSAWNREEVELYLRRAPADFALVVGLSPPRVAVVAGAAEGGPRPVVDLAGVPVEFRALSNSWQIFDAIRLYKSRFRMADADGKGYLTPAEFATLQAGNVRFESVDLNGDGEVTLEELESFFTLDGLAGQSRVVILFSDEATTLFDILDADGDRRLTRREFLEAPRRLAAYDRNGDGAISPGELASRFRITFTQPELLQTDPGSEMTRPQQRQPLVRENPSGPLWFRRMDRNGDGAITWREFLGRREMFDKLDEDGDGFITLEEAERGERLREAN